ncbi:MAG: efflux RND transporter periplasmic adaptor subunit [Candidatus Anaerobiospirillum merdipullorum]|uniref:Efflux RND transporter periplasmic adaptor subunit n=1 Tax=Candidatus Anaerobiospirillum merdipullorum TaxID=2838450 RepID=A0A9E2KMC8_9GAMM|nr:efflux RND transporter periplasmic adaptor subunit [Candidatus Anaerobiospirillum merdipullorum]
MASRHIKIISVVLGLALLGAGAYFYGCSSTAPTYMTVSPQMRDIKNQVFATGTLAGKVEVDVGAQVSGQIQKLYVKKGDKVTEGQLLCEIDPQIQENNLRTAQAQEKLIEAQIKAKQAELKKNRLEYQRQQTLRRQDATSAQELELAQANLEVSEADLAALEAQYQQAVIAVDDAKTNLGYTQIRAPMDGTVYAIPVEEGQTVNANQTTPTILKLAKLDVMTVETEISEADVVRVRPGMAASFTILGLQNQAFEASLVSIDPAPASAEDTTTQSSSSSSTTEAVYYNALLDVDNPEGLLRIDMTANVTITIAKKDNVLAIPLTALRSDDYQGHGSVYVAAKDGSVHEKALSLGLRDEQFIEVLDGLTSTDVVVIGDDVATAEAEALAKGRVPGRFR